MRVRRWKAAALGGILAASCLCTQVFAQTYTDECAASASDSICVYQNFSKRIEDFGSFSGWANCPDQSVLSMSGTEAQAVYQVVGAQEVRVEICSANGSFAVPGSAGAYWLGLYHTDSVSGAKRCFYDSGKDEVFINTSGGVRSLRVTMDGYAFLPYSRPL